jgi:hypothetical protein
MINERQEVGRRFLVAYLRGVRDYDDAFNHGKDQDAIVAILTKHTNIKDPAVFQKMRQVQSSAVLSPGCEGQRTVRMMESSSARQWCRTPGGQST